MTPKEHFDVARELIRHEDGLINNRVTWLLVLQGFLFNAFVAGVGLLEKFHGNHRAVTCITAGAVLIAMVGIVSSLTAKNVIAIAFRQMSAVHKWWAKTDSSHDFPPLSGELPVGLFYWLFSTGRMPWILVVVWLLIAGLVVVGVYP